MHRRRSTLGFYKLDFQGDGDLFTDENAAGLERRVVDQTEVFPVDFRGRGEPHTGISPGIFRGRRWALNREHDVAGDAMNGQVTGHGQLSIANAIEMRRLER